MKFNKKQKKIMRFGAIVLFCVALILILDEVFNKKIENYVGTWLIGYKFYEGSTDDKMIYMFIQEMHLNNDNTFYTYEKLKETGNESAVSGTYEVDGDTIILKYNQNGQDRTTNLYMKKGKLCLDTSCKKYYSKDKIDKYIEKFNAGSNEDGEQ